jgi:DNA gyrase subunit B
VNFVYETLIKPPPRAPRFLNAGVEIAFEDERVGKREVFKYEKGLVEYVAFLNEG